MNCHECVHSESRPNGYPCEYCQMYSRFEPKQTEQTIKDMYIHSIKVEEDYDPVNDPIHYKGNGIQVIDVIKAFDCGFMDGNVIKYVLRFDKKNGKQDLLKAKRYLEMLIEDCKE